MLEDLIHDRLLVLCNLDSNPLGDDDGDSTAYDVEARLLLTRFRHERVLEKGVKVELVVQDIGSEANGRVDGVLEEDVLVVGRCHGQSEQHRMASDSLATE